MRALTLYEEAGRHVEVVLAEKDRVNRDSTSTVLLASDNPDYLDALDLFERAFDLEPREKYHNELRPYYEQLGTVHDAVGAQVDATLAYARAFICAGDLRNAEIYGSTLVTRNPRDLDALALLVDVYLRQGNTGAAQNALDRFARAGGSEAQQQEYKGILAKKADKVPEAVDFFLASLKGNPNNLGVRYEAAELLRILKRGPEGVKVLDEGLKLGGSEDPAYLHRLGILLLSAKDNERALQVLEKAVEMAPFSDSARWDLARAYQRVGKVARSTEAMQQAIRINPGLAKRALEQ